MRRKSGSGHSLSLFYCYFSVASKGSLRVRTQRTSISLTSLGRERAKIRNNPEGQKELGLDTHINIIRIFELLQVYDSFLFSPVISPGWLCSFQRRNRAVVFFVRAGKGVFV